MVWKLERFNASISPGILNPRPNVLWLWPFICVFRCYIRDWEIAVSLWEQWPRARIQYCKPPAGWAQLRSTYLLRLELWPLQASCIGLVILGIQAESLTKGIIASSGLLSLFDKGQRKLKARSKCMFKRAQRCFLLIEQVWGREQTMRVDFLGILLMYPSGLLQTLQFFAKFIAS